MTRRVPLVRLLLLGAVVSATACEDMPAGPGGLEALVADSEVAAAGLSLRDLFAAALFRVQREEGTDTAFAVLSRWRAAREDAGATADPARIEAGTVLRAFGPDIVEQAAVVLSGELREADLAAGRVAADGRNLDMGSMQDELQSADVALARARSIATASPEQALLVLDSAASSLARIRMHLVEATGLPTLEVLYDEALSAAGDRAAEARGREAALTIALDSARAAGGIDDRYQAQDALRDHRAAFVVAVLGDDVADGILTEVSEQLVRMRPALDSLDRAGQDVSRDRRMAEAAQAIADRAGTALRAGDATRALDLAAHAAGLVDQLRRQRVR